MSLSSGSCLAGQEDEGIMTLGNVTNYLPVKKKNPLKVQPNTVKLYSSMTKCFSPNDVVILE